MRVAFFAALCVMVLRYGLYAMDRAPEGTSFMLVHLLALVLVIFFSGSAALRNDRESGFPLLVRDGFKAAAIYSLLYAVFIWAFFRRIDATHFPERIGQLVSLAKAEGQPEELVRERLELFFTPTNYATMTFFALLAFSALLALLLGLFHHRWLRHLRR
ncbi:MAG: DUF4199 family protein [Flavobacteriales bacterium]|nr:DUF4199 family protein [Flavobacteriales bacterium]MCB0815878.1 DUF4199 family protein [Flavobacteriales bacterium]